MGEAKEPDSVRPLSFHPPAFLTCDSTTAPATRRHRRHLRPPRRATEELLGFRCVVPLLTRFFRVEDLTPAPADAELDLRPSIEKW